MTGNAKKVEGVRAILENFVTTGDLRDGQRQEARGSPSHLGKLHGGVALFVANSSSSANSSWLCLWVWSSDLFVGLIVWVILWLCLWVWSSRWFWLRLVWPMGLLRLGLNCGGVWGLWSAESRPKGKCRLCWLVDLLGWVAGKERREWVRVLLEGGERKKMEVRWEREIIKIKEKKKSNKKVTIF